MLLQIKRSQGHGCKDPAPTRPLGETAAGAYDMLLDLKAGAGNAEDLNALDEEWAERKAKRIHIRSAIKTSAEYLQVMTLSLIDELAPNARPLSPDPTNRAISKRRWESSVIRWRNELKDILAGSSVFME